MVVMTWDEFDGTWRPWYRVYECYAVIIRFFLSTAVLLLF